MKFSTYLVQITGVSIYPIISLLLFVAFFVIVTYWVYSIDKKEIQRLENLPLDDNK
ncbi:MAG: CcoQ/FixQ family Cbb3-type cytochrome c oxidase assembly chaperone [Saprospiraceae bacterium]|jgi:cytochrome c oxidase cbb3-type subunit 3|nr:CcoQ/FixQ family Cbb3-type cytochrome c oxidase assembly chaperone [Saprospiraceae bacterium]